MKQMRKTPARFVLLIAAWLSSSMSGADPLHKVGNEGAWRHEDSGWMFPKQVGGFARVGAPYTIDGNNDVGVEYQQSSGEPRLEAVVDVYASDSAATEATLDGAKASAARKAGADARIRSETPFPIDALDGIRGVKFTYRADEALPGDQARLYFFATERWRVKVLASTQISGDDGDEALDAFVQALPWSTLGSDPGVLH